MEVEEPKIENEKVISASPEKAESEPAQEDLVEPEAAAPSDPEIKEKEVEVDDANEAEAEAWNNWKTRQFVIKSRLINSFTNLLFITKRVVGD